MSEHLSVGVAPGLRRHDLDALRAGAMLLGILLHAGLSFLPVPWPVHDSRQSLGFGAFVAAIHGFRMPLFFLLSGFFTAMLWRRRGLKPLVWHRFLRVFLPCMLGLVTVVPAAIWISKRAMESPGRTGAAVETGVAGEEAADIWSAAGRGDLAAIDRFAGEGVELNAMDPLLGVTPLSMAALSGHADAVELLLEKGAGIDASNRDGGTALHAAAFLGRVEAARLLIARGADAGLKNKLGHTPEASARVNWEITALIAGMLKLKLDEEAVKAGRLEVLALLEGENPGREKEGAAWVSFLMTGQVFLHLWFLWYLCWLVAGFAVVAGLGGWLNWGRLPDGLVLSPLRYLWLIPLTMLPQWFMGRLIPVFGADTWAAIIPAPRILIYYALFFGVGAIYHECDDREGRVGKMWWLTLPAALLAVFPAGVISTFVIQGGEGSIGPWLIRFISVASQAAYAWMMTFGLMGLFRRLLVRERRVVRYLSDSAYWLYLAHLPVVIAGQLLVRDWPLPALVKLGLLCVGVTGLLLAVYQFAIRYTWIGTMLNGKRVRGG